MEWENLLIIICKNNTMKINYHIKASLIAILGFLFVVLYIYNSQQNRFSYLMKNGSYTIAVGTDLEKRKIGRNSFTYEYKVYNKLYKGKNSATGNRGEMTVGGIYFVVFDQKNPDKKMLIKYPPVPAEINLDSIPAEGWSELPVSVPKDSIRNFLY